jgi:16S rRNA (adenine1518-N6/adenine1519-N6)-dimethyltransferase
MLQYRFNMEKLLDVPPESFRPEPKVSSAVVRMIPLPAGETRLHHEKLFADIVGTAFGQRRKTLRNTLRNYLSEDDFDRLDLDSRLRAENLDVKTFITIANYLGDFRRNFN